MRKAPVSSNPAECPAFRTVKAYKIKIKSHTIVRAKVVMDFT